MAEGFERVDPRLDGIDQRLNGMDKRFDNLMERVGAIERHLNIRSA